MNIIRIDSNRLLWNMPSQNPCQKMFRDMGLPVQNGGKENPAAKLSLSSEYRNMEKLRSLLPDSKGFEEKEVVPIIMTTDYFHMFHKSIQTGATLDEAAGSIVERYAERYDEIVRGYESGERELYIEDKTSEKGYRKLTMSEELGYLDTAFEKLVTRIDIQARRMPGFVTRLEKYGERLWQEGKLRQNEATLEYAAKIKEQAEQQKQRLPSGDLREKMLQASREFVRQYTSQGTGICVKDLLQTILDGWNVH